MSKEFDDLLKDTSSAIKSGVGAIVGSLGKVVALITLTVATLVTFTDVALIRAEPEEYTSTLAVMVVAAYVMYFSLLDVGEKRGEESSEYLKSLEAFRATRVKLKGEMMPALREFLAEYSKEELAYRRREFLMSYGLSEDDKFSSDMPPDKRRARIFGRAERMRISPLTAQVLLSETEERHGSETQNPERRRHLRAFIKLLPSILCMCVTVSVVLNIKDGMSAADVINGILKLSSLPIISIRGYVAGLTFASETKSAWLRTRTRVLEAFFAKECPK